MKILFSSGEVFPFSKTGGLAEVAASLPKALVDLGHEVVVISPFYKLLNKGALDFELLGVNTVNMGNIKQDALYYETTYDGIRYVFVDNKHYFDRDQFYGEIDDVERFSFFNYAILESLPVLDFYPDIIHSNDWQTALVPYLLDQYKNNPLYSKILTLLSIHNLEKQGTYSLEHESLLNQKNFTYIHLRQLNFLKTGIMRASAINTVSHSYRGEILTKFYGFSLDGPLKARQYDLRSILNGLHRNYNPRTDKLIYETFDEDSFIKGKEINKEKFLKEIKLKKHDELPIISFISRFGRQKGINLMENVIDEFLENKKFKFIVIGDGDAEYEVYFENLAEKYPDLVYYHHGFDQDLTLKAYAASDMFLMPSLFEPCGINQMIAVKYGAIPLVRLTGGLIDTVKSYPQNNDGFGFSFINYDDAELKEMINQALETYQNKEVWHKLQKTAIMQEYSIVEMAKEYETLYNDILKDNI